MGRQPVPDGQPAAAWNRRGRPQWPTGQLFRRSRWRRHSGSRRESGFSRRKGRTQSRRRHHFGQRRARSHRRHLREKLAAKREAKDKDKDKDQTVKLGVLRNKSEVSLTVELPAPASRAKRFISHRTNI